MNLIPSFNLGLTQLDHQTKDIIKFVSVDFEGDTYEFIENRSKPHNNPSKMKKVYVEKLQKNASSSFKSPIAKVLEKAVEDITLWHFLPKV